MNVANNYNDAVESYYNRNVALHPAQAAIRAKFVSFLSPGARILDLGCGPGLDAQRFTAQGFDVTGVDESPNMIVKAKQVAPQAQFIVKDMRELEFFQQFDAIFFSAALHTIPRNEVPGVIVSLAQAIKPGGILFVSFKEGEGESFKFDPRDSIEKPTTYYSIDGMKGLLRGFEAISTEAIEGLATHRWIYLICRRMQN